MKNIKKVIMSAIIIITIFCLGVTSYGFSVGDMTGKDPSNDAQNSINNLGQCVIKIISTVGTIISVVFLIILGIKYMTGSVEERANYKKTLLPYVIGASILFAASTLTSIIYNIAINL